MKIKKLLAVLLVVALLATSAVLLAACNKGDENDDAIKVAMITDYGDITDQSFNQTTYEACKAYCEANKLDFKYYKPSGDSTEARVASVNSAVQAGYNVIVMPGFAFAGTVVEVAENNPDVKFVALDVSQYDLSSAKYGENFTTHWKVPANVFCAVYQEELAGYMAGYAAVKEGYKKLGFLGGMAVPAVIRYGYGYVQGANDAAVEMNIASQVSVNYVYGGKFNGTPEIKAAMDAWHSNGVEVVFACGGGIFTSACEAAGTTGKVIGVDVDQSGIINKDDANDKTGYAAGMCITSAMKGLGATVKSVLADIIADKWDTYSGKVSTLGLVSGTDVEANYVQLPTATWSMTNFSLADYKALVAKLYDGTITVSADTSAMPTTTISVTTQANIH